MYSREKTPVFIIKLRYQKLQNAKTESVRTVLARVPCTCPTTQPMGVACPTDTQHQPGRALPGHSTGAGTAVREEGRRGRRDGDAGERLQPGAGQASATCPWHKGTLPSACSPLGTAVTSSLRSGAQDWGTRATPIPKLSPKAPAGTGEAQVVWTVPGAEVGGL